MARKKVEKNISYDDGKQLYYVNKDYGKDDSGKRQKSTSTYKTLAEAKKALKEFEADKTKGLLVTPKKAIVKEWLSSWMSDIIEPNKENTTIYSYKNIINHINPVLGNIAIQELKPNQIQQYYTKMINEGLSTTTVKKHHELLRATLKVAVMQGIILQNPTDRVVPPKASKKEAKYYDAEQASNLLKAVNNNRLELPSLLGICAGLRREEMCGLKWSDIDFESRIMTIQGARTMAGSEVIEKGTKNDSSTRQLHIADKLYEVLKREKAKQEENKAIFKTEYIENDYVIVWENGKPYRPNYLSELFTKFVKDNRLPEITLHGLRHTFASLANDSDATLFDISKALGHSTPVITGKIYTHMFDRTNEDTVKKVEDSLK
jgi:integrase